MSTDIELSILMPCLNESRTIRLCIEKAKNFLEQNNISGEIIISDNGSTDNSADIAISMGAKVINSSPAGYGAALTAGIQAARGRYVIMGDADDSYDFSNLNDFVCKLREGYDLVVGNRFKGGIEPGAMPFLHRYLGNPVLSFLGRLFYKTDIYDFHCGLRGFRRESISGLNLLTTGMEFASEMIVKASLAKLKITEVPTTLKRDGRDRPPHLNTWRDGWRHLRFLLIYSPSWLFLYPGLLIAIISLGLNLQNHFATQANILSCTLSNTLMILGFNSCAFYFLTWAYAVNNDFLPKSKNFKTIFSLFKLESGIIISILVFLSGILLFISAEKINNYMLASSLCLIGIEGILYSFVFSMIGIDRRKQ